MIKRIVEISQARTYLSVKLGQLIVRQGRATSETNIREGLNQIPCEDIGLLLVDHPGTTYTHSVFTTLLDCGAAIVLCGPDHHPLGVFLPIKNNSVQSARMRDQVMAKEPIKKQIWKQIVQTKIRHQAKIVSHNSKVHESLIALAQKVRSGDPENIEAQASRKYWSAFMSDLEFRRRIDGKVPNNLLNYGYMVMRAAVARALCGAGLMPSVGIHHQNKYNAFCLADDILEPFRGFVDAKVLEIWDERNGNEDFEDLNQPIKARLLEVLYEQIEISGQKGPLMVGLHKTAASLVKCFAGQQKVLDLPRI